MADEVDPERMQATAEFRKLTASLGIRTPRKLARLAAMNKSIRAAKGGKRKIKGG